MIKGQRITPVMGVDLNTDETYIDPRKATFLKNVQIKETNNTGVTTEEGGNALAITPKLGNTPYTTFPLPAGINKAIGTHEHKERNHLYVFVWNSLQNHFIYRIIGDTGQCEKVYQSRYLNFRLDPRHFIAEGRCVVEVATRIHHITRQPIQVSYIIFTDFNDEVRFICAEDAIATNSFDSTDFPFFIHGISSPAHLINLGVTEPRQGVSVSPIERDTSDAVEMAEANRLNYRAWQWRTRYVDVWGRPSEYGPASDTYMNASGSDCLANSASAPRCVKMKLDAGPATVVQVELLFRTNLTEGGWSDWFLYDTIDKYEQGPNPWYQLPMRSDLNHDVATNTIEYIFCADKERVPVPQKDTNRLENYLPKKASSVVRMNRRIGLLNTEHGFEPMATKEVDKMQLTVNTPTPSACGTPKSYKVTIQGVIWNPYENEFCPMYKKDNKIVFGLGDCYGGLPWYEGLLSLAKMNNPFVYGQVLPDGQEGIIGYMAGTGIYAISKQYRVNRVTQEAEYVGLEYTSGGLLSRDVPVIRWEFMLPPGKYVFRIASHQASPSDDYEKTSTRLHGRISMSDPDGLINQDKELVIEVVDKDIEVLETAFKICEATSIGKNCASVNRVSLADGYLYEDELEKRPIEMALINKNKGSCVFPKYTDHNGYYFILSKERGIHSRLFGWKGCDHSKLLEEGRETRDSNSGLWRHDVLYAYEKETPYPSKDRYLIKGRVHLCGNETVGLPGVLVILRNGGTAVTNSRGEYTIVAHGLWDTANPRTDKLIIGQRGTCVLLSCGADNCSYSFEDIATRSPACGPDIRINEVASMAVRLRDANSRGPQKGGRYGVGMVLQDWMGRKSFVEMRDQHYVNIPTVQQSGTYQYSRIQYDLSGVTYPDYVDRISFYVTDNLNYDDFLVWAVDRVQYVDNSGKPNKSGATAIRLYYEGLSEYNKQKGYRTTTTWDVIADTGPELVEGDEVEFIANGDGTLFTQSVTALVRYDKEGKYLQVEYSDALKDLTDGCQIKMYRPRKESDKRFFYEVFPMIPVRGGKATIPTGIVNVVDSYLVNRTIPVPVEIIKTDRDADGNEIVTSETDNQVRIYPFPFEHHAPSDIWGGHANNRGRVSVRNPYAKTQYMRSEVAPSAALSVQGQFNGLHYFDAEKAVQLDEQEFGGIVVGITDLNTLLGICEHDYFVLGFDDNRVYINDQGQAFSRSGADGIGRPDRKTGNNYGCQLVDINTIRRHKDRVMYLDAASSALVQHNFGSAVNVAATDVQSWLSSKIKHVRATGSAGRYFHGGIDMKCGEYLLTDISLLASVAGDYINDLPNPAPSLPETIGYDMDTKAFKFYSFVPEYYGLLQGDRNDVQLISFKQGIPYYHYAINSNTMGYCNFFGSSVDPVIEVVFNQDGEATKQWQWVEILSRTLFYCDRLETETGQVSRLMPRWFNHFDRKWAADFKCATKAGEEKSLLEGDPLRGRWVKARFLVKDSDKGKYFELVGFETFFFQK